MYFMCIMYIMYIYLRFLHATVWRAIFGRVERARLFVSTSSPDIITIISRVSIVHGWRMVKTKLSLSLSVRDHSLGLARQP